MRKSRVQRIWENAVVFYLGGMFYCTVELLWRQWTHGSMFLLGGLCFWTVSSLGRRVRMPLLAQMALGACIVTFFEFWTGVLVNRVMHLGVWDYSAAPFNLLAYILAIGSADSNFRSTKFRADSLPLLISSWLKSVVFNFITVMLLF